jgi:hypothetical protein
MLAEVGSEEAGAAGNYAGAHRALMLQGVCSLRASTRSLQFPIFSTSYSSSRGESFFSPRVFIGMFEPQS